MAAILDCSADTLERRYKDELELGRQKRNASLRRKQFEVAMNGDKTMLIWLGKQFLGQRDKLEHSGSMDVQLGWVAKLSDEELEAQLKARGVNVGPQAAG